MHMMAKDRADFERSAEVIHQWLAALELEDSNEIDVEELGDSLDDLNLLSWAGASDSDLCAGVTRARRSGCGWAPIALALGIPHHEARYYHSIESPARSFLRPLLIRWIDIFRALNRGVATLTQAFVDQQPAKLFRIAEDRIAVTSTRRNMNSNIQL